MADKKNNRRNNRNNNDDDFNPKFKKNLVLDYKNPEQLKKFINERGKILPRRATGACAKHQRDITLEVKRCRQIAMLPYTQE